MTERHLRCEADGCHFCCCCASKYDRLGCLRRHVVWHIQNMFTTPLPPRNTILLLDELEEWEDKQNVTSSSCDEAKLKDRENFGRSVKVPKGARDPNKSPLENFNDSNQKLLAEVPDKVPKGAHDPEKVETSKTEPKTATNPSNNLDSENVQGNDNPSQQSNNLKKKKLPLHEGMPPAQVPLSMVAGNLHQFTWYRTSKEKNNKWIINIRIDTGLVACNKIITGLVVYTRIIIDSTRIFDRGRLAGHDVPAGQHQPLHLLPRGEITGVPLRSSSSRHNTYSGIVAALHQ